MNPLKKIEGQNECTGKVKKVNILSLPKRIVARDSAREKGSYWTYYKK